MNPIIQENVTIDVPMQGVQIREVDSTEWFNTVKKEPGQPGVFEVNVVKQFDGEESPRRFSFFNGKRFGPISSTPNGAFNERFNVSSLTAGITAFRGLVEAA